MAKIKIIKGSELPIVDDINKSTFLAYEDKTVSLKSGRIDFKTMTPLFGVSQKKGQSLTLVPSQKLFTDEIEGLAKKVPEKAVTYETTYSNIPIPASSLLYGRDLNTNGTTGSIVVANIGTMINKMLLEPDTTYVVDPHTADGKYLSHVHSIVHLYNTLNEGASTTKIDLSDGRFVFKTNTTELYMSTLLKRWYGGAPFDVSATLRVYKLEGDHQSINLLIEGNKIDIQAIPKITNLEDGKRFVSSKAVNDFIDRHFKKDGAVGVWEDIRSVPDATSYTDYPMGTINPADGSIASAASANRRWSGNIDVSNVDKLIFDKLGSVGKPLYPEYNGVIRFSFADANNKALLVVDGHSENKEIVVPSGSKYFRHNVYAAEYQTIDIANYKLLAFRYADAVKNENLKKLIETTINNTPLRGYNNDIAMEFLGVKLTASQTGRSTVSFPSIIRADRYLDNPLAKYYIYFSSDHGNSNTIMMAHANDIEGEWSYHGHVLTSHEQGIAGDCETPCVIWEVKTKRFLMYWHTGTAVDGHSQNTYISESKDGLNWTFVGKAFKFPARFVNGDGHNGYLTVVYQNGLYIGNHCITGSNMSRTVRALSKDGINWVTELDTLAPFAWATFTVNGEIYHVTDRAEEGAVTSPVVVCCKLSNDLKREIGTYFEVGSSQFAHFSVANSFTDSNGTIYIILSDNAVVDPNNNSSAVQAKAFTLYKININHKVFK